MNQWTGGSETAMFPRLHIQSAISRSFEKSRAAAFLNHGVVSSQARCIFAASYQPPLYGAYTPVYGSEPDDLRASVIGGAYRLHSTSVSGSAP